MPTVTENPLTTFTLLGVQPMDRDAYLAGARDAQALWYEVLSLLHDFRKNQAAK